MTHNISQWVDDYTDEMLSWALHKTSNIEVAKDLIQDTFVAALVKIDSFKQKSSPKTWLFSILNNKIIDHYRKKIKRAVDIHDQVVSNYFDEHGTWLKDKRPQNWETDNHLLDDTEFQSVLEKCIENLPDKWEDSIRLKYLMEKNGKEICQVLNLSPTNFWQIIHRAKLQLRDCIEISWFENPLSR